MTEPSTQKPSPLSESAGDETLAGQTTPWPWWVKVGSAIALAAIWIAIFAKPALGA